MLTHRLMVLALLAFAPQAGGEEIRVAVAANFVRPLEALSAGFEARTGNRIVPIPGSTGTLYAQIRAGSPVHVFLAADQKRPARLAEEGHAIAASLTTYAIGRLALWSPGRTLSGPEYLKRDDAGRIAIANPRLAPFGAAAQQTLEHLGAGRVKLVFGQNVAHAHTLTASGAVAAGFVALSLVREEKGIWEVPPHMHEPIRQDGVITRFGARSPAASAFMQYLASAEASAIITRHGYATAASLPRIP